MVYRFLVTGVDTQLRRFYYKAHLLLYAHERRGQTVFYTCMEEDRQIAIEIARSTGVTMQELHIHEGGPTRETFETLVDNGPGWQPPESGEEKDNADRTGATD